MGQKVDIVLGFLPHVRMELVTIDGKGVSPVSKLPREGNENKGGRKVE